MPAVQRLAGRRALVTGSTRGIGRAIATALALEGASVLVSGRDARLGQEVVAQIGAAGGTAAFAPGDLGAGTDAIHALAAGAAETLGGPVDVLVNNAGLLSPAQPLTEITQEQIERTLAVNVTAPFLLSAAVVPGMLAAGGGAIVNVGSIAGVQGMAGGALYGASKAALHQLTRTWAVELAGSGVRVNAVIPGVTATERTERHPEVLRRLSSGTPAGRPARAREVAAAVTFLASEEAAHVHGALLPVDGGALLGAG